MLLLIPNARNITDAKYVGRRFFTSKKSLENALIYDPEKGKMVKRYKDLDSVRENAEAGGIDAESDKAIKDSALGSVSPDKGAQVEVIEIWTHEEVCVIANRTTVIEHRENPYYTLNKSKFEQRRLEWEIERLINCKKLQARRYWRV